MQSSSGQSLLARAYCFLLHDAAALYRYNLLNKWLPSVSINPWLLCLRAFISRAYCFVLTLCSSWLFIDDFIFVWTRVCFKPIRGFLIILPFGVSLIKLKLTYLFQMKAFVEIYLCYNWRKVHFTFHQRQSVHVFWRKLYNLNTH